MKKSVSLLLLVALISALAFPLDNVFAKDKVETRDIRISLTDASVALGNGSSNSNWSVGVNFSTVWSASTIESRLESAYKSKYGADASLANDLAGATSISCSVNVRGSLSYTSTGAQTSMIAGGSGTMTAGGRDIDTETVSLSGQLYPPDMVSSGGSFNLLPDEYPQLSVSCAGNYSFSTLPASFYPNAQVGYGAVQVNWSAEGDVILSFSTSTPLSTNEAVNDILDNQEAYHQEELDKGEQTGTDIQSSSSELEGLGGEEGKWKILWFPLTFTKQVIGVFTGANAVNIANEQVVGFRYDEETGMLVKVHSYDPVTIDGDGGSITIPLPNVGTKITFPSVDLPMIGTVWEPYTFDLAAVKEQFPLVFNAIYLVISVLEVYWFIGFLHDKYEEVFG